MSDTTPIRIILGARTRLGETLASRSAGRQLRLVATSSRPTPAPDAAELVGGSGAPVELVVCALGPVHPTEAQSELDHQVFRRDLEIVSDVLHRAEGRSVSVVLVSTVIALAPGDDRRYYGGWKNLVEGELRDLVGRHSGAALAVLYPGRLVADADRSFLHATYGRLADRVEALLAGRSVPAVVGLDARAWLAVATLRTALRALLPGRTASRPSSSSRPTESRSAA